MPSPNASTTVRPDGSVAFAHQSSHCCSERSLKYSAAQPIGSSSAGGSVDSAGGGRQRRPVGHAGEHVLVEVEQHPHAVGLDRVDRRRDLVEVGLVDHADLGHEGVGPDAEADAVEAAAGEQVEVGRTEPPVLQRREPRRDFRTEFTPWIVTTRPSASIMSRPRNGIGPTTSGGAVSTTSPAPVGNRTSGSDGAAQAPTTTNRAAAAAIPRTLPIPPPP